MNYDHEKSELEKRRTEKYTCPVSGFWTPIIMLFTQTSCKLVILHDHKCHLPTAECKYQR